MRAVNRLIVHCSATRPTQDIGVLEIGRWHAEREFNEIGYHFVIRRDGTLEEGRPVSIQGAHTLGHNVDSIGICMVGGVNEAGDPDANFTFKQWAELNSLLQRLSQEYPIDSISGHRDYSNKACPCFDVKAFFSLEDFRRGN